MDSETKFWICVILVICLIPAAIIAGVSHQDKNECKALGFTFDLPFTYNIFDGCQVQSPEYGWMGWDEYVTLVGKQTLLERK